MARIPNYKQWIQDTELNAFHPRNAALKTLDESIRQYERSRSGRDLWRIRNAFEDWKRGEGPLWQQSPRNRKQAMTLLERELAGAADARTWQISHLTMAELMALAHVARERKRVLKNIFSNKQVTLKAARLKDGLASAGEKVKSTCQQAGAWLTSSKRAGRTPSVPVRDKMIAMAASLFEVDRLEQLGALGGLILSVLEKCAVSVPPVVGQIKDGYDLFAGWAKVGAGLYTRHNISERSYVIDTGVPANAFAALKKCLEEETRHQAISAGNATTSFALKTGLAFVDGGAISGPVVGAVSALAEFAHLLYLLGMEYRATKAINRSLEEDTLDIRLFKTYPLMGCYLLVSATLSDLIPIDCFGTPGWMDYIESTHQKLFPDVYNAATNLIDQSPWEIIGLPKRPTGTSCGVVSEAQRLFSVASPLSGLAGLRSLAA
ncbi:MAG TPA: hypothetical protein VMH81_13360 [Bryobacteraceae bacterium]|nr:hypothetical protein [Bryobacteraceae bacterium]